MPVYRLLSRVTISSWRAPTVGFTTILVRKSVLLKAMSPACLVTNCDKRNYAQKLWRVTRQAAQRTFGGVPSRVAHVITVSEKGEAVLKPYLPSSVCLHRVNNPVYVEKGTPVNPAQGDSFVVIGRLDPEKGPLLAAKAFAQTGVKAVFVGEGACTH